MVKSVSRSVTAADLVIMRRYIARMVSNRREVKRAAILESFKLLRNSECKFKNKSDAMKAKYGGYL